jgi:hypothetical protein
LRGNPDRATLFEGDQDFVQEWAGGPWREFVPLSHCRLPELLEHVAEPLAHLGRGVDVDRVHAMHGVAAAVHLEHLVHV